MQRKAAVTTIPSAGRLVSSLFGGLAGLGGITHGIGEVLQGNVAPDGLVMNSWAEGPIANYMGGEPAMTIVPNLLVTGVLTIIVAVAVIACAAAFVQGKHGGRILVALSITMLLFGGGFGPPIIGILAGGAGIRADASRAGQRRQLSGGVLPFVAKLWPWVFGVAVVSGTFLVVGSVILVYLFGLNYPDLFLNSFYLTVLSLLLTVWLAPTYDAYNRTDRDAVTPILDRGGQNG